MNFLMKNFVGYTLKVIVKSEYAITFGGFFPKVAKRNKNGNRRQRIKVQLENIR